MVLAVSGISAVGDISSRYDVLSVYGNPRSIQPVESVGNESSKSSILVNVAPKIEDVVANEHDKRSIEQVASGSYADIIKIRDIISNNSVGESNNNTEYRSNLMDIKDKMMAGIYTKIPSTEVKGNDRPDALESSISDSENYKIESDQTQLDKITEAYNYKKMILAYETTMLYAG